MGYYIDQLSTGTALPTKNKAEYLLRDGGIEVPHPKEFVENLVCVVDNGFFEAAGFCYSPSEFEAFSDTRDSRPKRWIVYPHAKEMSGYQR